MTRTDRRLLLAFLLSLAVHALPLLPSNAKNVRKPKAATTLNARLKLPPLPVPTPILPEPEPPSPAQKPPPPAIPQKVQKPPAKAIHWEAAIRQQMKKLRDKGRYYSREAIELGLEGDPVVLMVLDEAGNVTAARIEESSGHAILDRDALNAVRSLRYLPADAPREAYLPLRFRLKD